MSEVRSRWLLLGFAAAVAVVAGALLVRVPAAEGQGLRDEAKARQVPFSVATAVVVDNQEAMSTGRVKVKFPWLRGSSDRRSVEARLYLPVGVHRDDAFLWIPEVDDEVLVSFAQGDMRRPIILGGLWNGMDESPR